MSWRVLRTDDIERLTSITVQFEEMKRLIELGTATHARLAFLLIDNAAETLMFRNIECLLSSTHLHEQLLRRYDELLELTDERGILQNRDEIADQIVPKRRRAELRRNFNAKADFLCEHDCLEGTQARVLKRLHGYRNELYHRDTIRAETIQPACLLYFDLACTLLEHLRQFETYSIVKTVPATLAKYRQSDVSWGTPSTRDIAAQLRVGLGIDDTAMRHFLIEHLTSRLNDIDNRVDYLEQSIFPGMREIFLGGPWRELIIRVAQVHEDYDEPPDIDELLQLTLRYGPPDLPRWRAAVEQLAGHEDSLSLFAAFADIEEDMEPFETQLEDLAERFSIEEQRAEDMRRRK